LSHQANRDAEAALRVERLMEQRANIVKNAEEKYSAFERILLELRQKGELRNLLVFVSPQQIQTVMGILVRQGIIFHKLTEAEGTKAESRYGGVSEREYIIQKFKSGDYQALVAIKCLDEGIDIPSADVGILMASSTNPREYVQRIGRIIRQDSGKRFAHLYDLCVSTLDGLDDEEATLERKIKKKEVTRLREIAENAINAAETLEIITSLNY
jgi:superfamily II DNA or RNA helicase